MTSWFWSEEKKQPKGDLAQLIRVEVKEILGYTLRMDNVQLRNELEKFMNFGKYEKSVEIING